MTSSRRRLPPGPAVVGIVNVTPDSFSDGGRFTDPGQALDHALALIDEGAAALDLGAESTRPGAAEVPASVQWARLGPVLEALRPRCDVPLSIDTRHSELARRALDAGADVINDVSGLRHEPGLARVVAEAGAGLILMHSRGVPGDMASFSVYQDVVAEVRAELAASLALARASGCPEDGLVLDPGFGFAKNASHNLELLEGLPELASLGRPLLVGLSRKALVGHLLARDGQPRPVDRRVFGSIGLALSAVARGACLIRAHDVRETADALACFVAASGLRDPAMGRHLQATGQDPGDTSCPAG